MRRLAVLLATLLVVGPLTVAPAHGADRVHPLRHCAGKRGPNLGAYRYAMVRWYGKGLVSYVEPGTTHVVTGYFVGRQDLGFWLCPNYKRPAWIAPTGLMYCLHSRDEYASAVMHGLRNRMFMYDSHENADGDPAHKNWNMGWHYVKNEMRTKPQCLYYSAPGSINHQKKMVHFLRKDDPRMRASMKGEWLNGLGIPEVVWDYKRKGKEVNHVLGHAATQYGAWQHPGERISRRR